MQISQFNGGINTRLAAHLIQTNEAVECSNAVITDGQVTSIKAHKDLNSPIKANLKNFKGKWLSFDEDTTFAHFQGRLFKSSSVNSPLMTLDGYKWYPLSLKPPKQAPTITANTILKLTEFEEVKKEYSPITADIYDQMYGVRGFRDTTNLLGGNWVGYRRRSNVDADMYVKDGWGIPDFREDFSWTNGLEGRKKLIYGVPYATKESGNVGEDCGWLDLYAFVELPESEQTKRWSGGQWEFCTCGLHAHPYYPGLLQSDKVRTFSNSVNKAKMFEKLNDEIVEYQIKKVDYGSRMDFNNMTPDPLVQGTWHSTLWAITDTKLASSYNNYTHWEPNKSYTYTILWTNTSTHELTTESVSLTTPPTFDGLLFWGWKFKKKVGYTATIYRDGRKCDIVESGDWYFDNKTPSQIETLDQLGLKISYCYTYFSEFTGAESAPSPFSNKLPNTFDLLYLNFEPPEYDSVTHIKIYRLGLGKTEMSLVKQIPVGQLQYGDLLTAPIDGAILDTWDNLPPPDEMVYITSTISLLFGAKDSTLYYCNPGKPYAWAKQNYINFDDTITGLGLTPNGLLVFTRFKTYIVTGDSPRNFAKFLVSNSIGCRSHKSIQSIRQTLIWLSDDCLCISSGGDIDKFTTKKLSKFESYTPRCSAVIDDVYYLSYAGGVWCIDFKTGGTITHLSQSYLGLAVSENSLFACLDGNLVELFKGEGVETLRYKTPNFADGVLSVMKLYKQIYFFCGGSLEVEVFVDGESVGKYPLVSGFNEVKLPAEKSKGYYISFAFEGQGTLSEIEYKVEGRQNAR